MMATMYQTRTMAIPEIQPELTEFWDASSEGKLLLKQCDDCKEYHFYPRLLCPFCHSEKTSWTEAKGTGTIYTYSVMRRGVPYAIGFVELDEGPRVLTNLVDCDLDTIKINQPVKVVFKQSGDEDHSGPFIPCFTPA